MMRKIFGAPLLALAVTALFSSCLEDKLAGGSEAGNAEVVAGQALYTDGQSVAYARVYAVPRDGFVTDSVRVDSTQADAAGRFMLASLKPGHYRLEINDRQGQAQLQEIEVPTTYDTLRTGSAYLKPTRALKGRIALDGVQSPVTLRVKGLHRQLRLATGMADFTIADMPEGDYEIEIVPDYGGLTRRVQSVSVRSEFEPPPLIAELNEDYGSWSRAARVRIFVGNEGPREILRGFPLLMRFNSRNFDFAQAKPDGSDLRFAREDGTHLDFEIARWSAANQSGEIWVRMDSLIAGGGTQSLRMFWGKPEAALRSQPSAVFDTALGYAGVYHFERAYAESDTGMTQIAYSTNRRRAQADDPPWIYFDATANQAHAVGTRLASASVDYGISGLGLDLSHNYRQFLTLERENVFDFKQSFTLSAWTRIESFDTAYQALFSKGGQTWGLSRSANGRGIALLHRGLTGPDTLAYSEGNLNLIDDRWHLWTAVYNGSQIFIYLDGELRLAREMTGELAANDSPVLIGSHALYPERNWEGGIDEVQLSRRAFSAAWINLSFENQRPSSDLIYWD